MAVVACNAALRSARDELTEVRLRFPRLLSNFSSIVRPSHSHLHLEQTYLLLCFSILGHAGFLHPWSHSTTILNRPLVCSTIFETRKSINSRTRPYLCRGNSNLQSLYIQKKRAKICNKRFVLPTAAISYAGRRGL